MNLFTRAVIVALVILSIILTASALFPESTSETVILSILGDGAAIAAFAALGAGVFGRRGSSGDDWVKR
ncbi:hypothetical protein MPC4_350028 [Methylocella tundrae]|uniref:Uncharacterized protein n=1 Tax=Methylocella tundrae TaxID=227605 RepID=A0A8B6M923_METTU|nr:hypothetical protein [Methylocella tundrae]VTZ22733.1 hypothetical protein MPC1_12990004 [Methylocella tundrae]VTZ51322.1 hypothetical protein MPC4_350028 [Methylocella tundrae]